MFASKALLISVFFLLPALLCAAPEAKNKSSDPHAGLDRMNGYSLSDYPNFLNDWAFVTVRYRKDTGEMRITYANDAAWKTLQEGKIDYPDGAVFAKVGLMTGEDPGFVSSLVPSGAKRFQLMVMDKAKNKDTDGWGYAVFDKEGKTLGDDPHEKALACHACHKLVPERGYVFSQPVKLNMGLPGGIAILGKSENLLPVSKLVFETAGASSLPDLLKKSLPDSVKEVRFLRGPLEDTTFQGTMGEIRPSLAHEAMRAGIPAVLVNKRGDLFSFVMQHPDDPSCVLENGQKGMNLRILYTEIMRGPKKNVTLLEKLEYCDAPPAQK